MVPVGTGAKAWRSPAISLYWSCRPTARNSIRSSGFGTICAATGSPTRYFPAWRTSWMPARWPGTGSPLTTAWSARFARSPGLQLRPLHKEWLLSNRGLRYKIHPYPTTSGDSYYTPDARLTYAGRVGTGMPVAELERVWCRLQPLAIDQMPLSEPPPSGARNHGT